MFPLGPSNLIVIFEKIIAKQRVRTFPSHFENSLITKQNYFDDELSTFKIDYILIDLKYSFIETNFGIACAYNILITPWQ